MALAVTWSAVSPVGVIVQDENFYYASLTFRVTGPAGQRIYRESPRGVVDVIQPETKLEKGQRLTKRHFLVLGSYGAGSSFLFPEPGEYVLVAAYGDVVSNMVRFHVSKPSDDEITVFEVLRANPEFALGSVARASRRAFDELIEKHPRSRYLAIARMKRAKERHAALLNRQNPDTGDSLWHLDKAEFRDFERRFLARMATDLLSEAWGALESERLGLAVQFADQAEEASIAAQARKELATLERADGDARQ